jgi:hypothetical protein
MGNKLSESDSQMLINMTNQLSDSKQYCLTLLKDKVELWIESSMVSTRCCCKN